MKPQMLKITGINSFNEIQQLDFSKILQNGMFGIFGNTGSGKSTILDCITLALYGKIVRYDDKRGNGDFLNLNRDSGEVEFIFSIKDGKDEIFYEIVRKFKKSKKGEISLNLIRLSILKDSKREIIADKKKEVENEIINLLGLSYEDFTKAVVLPQGKFSEFLMLENSDKRKMLQRIFNLEKYGDLLNKKINEKKNEKEREVIKLKQELDFFGDISEENIQKDEKNLEEQEKQLNNINNKLKDMEKEKNYYTNILKLKEDLYYYEQELNKLKPYENKVLEFKDKLKFIEEAEKIAPNINELNKLEEEKEKLINDINKLNNEFENIKNKYDDIEENHNYYKSEKEEISQLERIKQELNQIINLIEEEKILNRDIENIKIKLENINSEKILYINNIEKENEKIENLNKEIESIIIFSEENKINEEFKKSLEECVALKNKENEIKNKIEEIEKTINNYNKEIKDNELNKIKLEEDILYIKNEIENVIISNINNLKNKIEENENLKNIKENENKNIENKINELNIQIKVQDKKELWQDLVNKLEENKPCPICGSIEHPNPIKIVLDNITNNLKNEIEENENNLKKNLEYINDLNTKNEIIDNRIKDINNITSKYNIEFNKYIDNEYIYNEDDILKNIDNRENKLNELHIKLNTIITENENKQNVKEKENENLEKNNNLLLDIENQLYSYINKFKIDDFYKEYENILNIENKIKENKEKHLKIKEQIDKLNEEMQKSKDKINEIGIDEASLKATLKLKEEEKEKNILDYNNKIEKFSFNKDPKEYLNEIEQKINNILEKEEKYKKLYNEILEKKNKTENDIKVNEKLIEDKESSITNKEKDITKLLKESIFENKEKVIESFKEKNQKEYYKQKIESFENKYKEFTFNIEKYKKELDNLKVDKNLFIDNIKEIIKNIDNEKENINNKQKIYINNIALLKVKIEKNKKDFEKIENILKILKKEEKKFDLLKELSDLNKGAVFVEYIANKQLNHIVVDASKRLYNMSQSKYSLELLDNNFVIKDNYNGGVMRSPRSLSGGEVFMASLSLALSLSSKIQLKNKSPLEVFFLDEGFGTLDNNTLDIVINTLEQLQISNISVGIITHVEEIKNRVQNKINVIATENGTKINI